MFVFVCVGDFSNFLSIAPTMHKPNQICIVTNVSCLSVPSLLPSSDTDGDTRIVLSCSQWASEVVPTIGYIEIVNFEARALLLEI